MNRPYVLTIRARIDGAQGVYTRRLRFFGTDHESTYKAFELFNKSLHTRYEVLETEGHEIGEKC